VFDPHDPYEPYPPYNTLWADPSQKKTYEMYVEAAKKFIVDPMRKHYFELPSRKEFEKTGYDPDKFVSMMNNWYDGSIRGMDVEIGRLFERLKQLGLDDKTLVIFTSDHGEEFFDHGDTLHGHTAYSELNHAPLIVRMPGVVPEGIEISQTVRTIDIMPTILEMCRLPTPEEAQGQSLVPLLLEARQASRKSIASSHWNVAFAANRWRNEAAVTEQAFSKVWPRYGESYAILLDGWKLIHYTQPSEDHPEVGLYDHRNDPLDKNNLAREHPEIVTRLLEELKTWKEMATAARLPDAADVESDLSADELQRLRSLGYIR
jgi:arylsulfatase A-like enzyme